jgi:hypothetical protein
MVDDRAGYGKRELRRAAGRWATYRLPRECAVCYRLPIRGSGGMRCISLLHGQARDVRRQENSC